jgi:hypothetical protein
LRPGPARDEQEFYVLAVQLAANVMQAGHAHCIFNAYALYSIKEAVTKSVDL